MEQLLFLCAHWRGIIPENYLDQKGENMIIKNMIKFVLSKATVAAIVLFAVLGSNVYSKELQVLGTWSFMDQWNKIQKPFWSEEVSSITEGRVTGKAVSQTEAGLSGTETIRLLNLGVFDVAHGPIAYVSGDAQAIDGIELPMLATTMDEFREIVDAYMPVLNQVFEEKFNAKLLSIYTLPRMQMYCNFGKNASEKITLEDLKGKKIRTFSAALGDFVKAIGATPVSIAFGEVIPALQTGVADCGITASLSAYNAKWYQVTTHAIQVNVGYSAGFMAMNLDIWKSLAKEDRKAIEDAMVELWNESWSIEAANESKGENCLTNGTCEKENGGLIPVYFSAEENNKLKSIFGDVVVNGWAQRCGTNSCVEAWNKLVGAKVGVKAKLPN